MALATAPADGVIRERLMAELERQKWASVGWLKVVVQNGMADLRGTIPITSPDRCSNDNGRQHASLPELRSAYDACACHAADWRTPRIAYVRMSSFAELPLLTPLTIYPRGQRRPGRSRLEIIAFPLDFGH
jgi:hypothetical protein